jgi:hypothetical protein
LKTDYLEKVKKKKKKEKEKEKKALKGEKQRNFNEV